MGTITYPRGTTYAITHNYTGPYLGETLYFTVKNAPYDTDPADTTNSIMTPKNIPMSGSLSPQSTVIQINPTDVGDTVDPSVAYYYDIKILDTNGDVYLADSGDFVLTASPTNRE